MNHNTVAIVYEGIYFVKYLGTFNALWADFEQLLD